jgi:uncharacterized protein YjbI with pentapeptide repeats
LAETSYDNPETSEGWAWDRIKRGEKADFNIRCGTPSLDPRASDEKSEKSWQVDCRRLSARFLIDVLTKAPLSDQVPLGGVHVVGARIVGDINLRSTRLNRELAIEQSRIEGKVDLEGARTDSNLYFNGSRIARTVHALQLRAEQSLNLSNAAFQQEVTLASAKIDGDLNMERTKFNANLNAESLQVGANLFMRNVANFKDVRLAGAKVAGQISMIGARFDGKLDADALQVGGMLLMRSEDENKASFKEVDLRGANITGQIDMRGARFDGKLDADALQVGGMLLMRSEGENKASFKEVVLRGANIRDQIDMTGARFDGNLNADSLQVGATLFMRAAVCAQKVHAAFAKVNGNLDLRGTTLARLDLSGASVAGELRVGFLDQSLPFTDWKTEEGAPGDLSLRDARIGSLVDTRDAWPQRDHLHLDGFAFARLGGFQQQRESEARSRGAKWWDQWARRDTHYSPHVYQQLAAAFTAAGDRNLADEIRYLGQVREHETLTGWSWIWSALLRWIAGFGIGSYPFRVLYWVAGVSLAGGFYLWTCSNGVQTSGHGFVWCWGASLARLLPLIEINKEFTDFFNDPLRNRLTDIQTFVFSFIGVLGWFLATVLVAAVSGVTRKS